MVEVGLALSSMRSMSSSASFAPPAGLGWNGTPTSLSAARFGDTYMVDVNPRDLVDPAIWSGPAYHVDGVSGDDNNSGLGTVDGDFSAAKKSIHAAFTAGNATGSAYRVLINSGEFDGSASSKNNHLQTSNRLQCLSTLKAL
jgi:hypothetical protein